jgi:hypothetical protein
MVSGDISSVVCRRNCARERRPCFILQCRKALTSCLNFLGSQVRLGEVLGGLCVSGGSKGHMVAAWSMCFERKVLNWEARVSRSLVEAVAGDVLRIAACGVAVWLKRSCVLVW